MTPEELSEADYDAHGLGVVFRVSNERHRRLGRMTVWMQEFTGAMKTHSRAVAADLAGLVGGRVVPYSVAERMGRKRDRRRMGWPLAWVLHDLPARVRI